MLNTNEDHGGGSAPRRTITIIALVCALGILIAGVTLAERWFTHDLIITNRDTQGAAATSSTDTSTTTPSTAATSTATTTTATSTEYSIGTTTDDMPHLGYKKVITTLFWAGEGATDDNGYIQNFQSAWDEDWSTHFGGIDDPECRKDYHPCDFTPKENPFYFALPYSEFDDEGNLHPLASKIPWFAESQRLKTPLLKNRWIEVRYEKNVCYGQWEDVGPFEEHDFDYVFGNAKPKNQYGEKAGLDVSPALWKCLGLVTNMPTEWRFVEEKDVPTGPWKKIVTRSGINWK